MNFVLETCNVAKDEKDLCRCCHAEGSHKSLYTEYLWMQVLEEVVFSDTIRECFSIELLEMREESQQIISTICDTCIQRLQDAVSFRRQILKCEKRFREVYEGCVKEETAPEASIKIEVMNEDAKDDAMLGLAGFDYGSPSDGEIPDDGNDMPENNEVGKNKKKKLTEMEPEPEEVLDVYKGVPLVRVKKLIPKLKVDYIKTGAGFQCLKCPEFNPSRAPLRLHVIKDHFKCGKYKCPECIDTFLRLTDLVKHKFEKHNIDNRYKCNACDKAYYSDRSLNFHVTSFHMLGEKLKCEMCPYESFHKQVIQRHSLVHKSTKKHQCSFCHKKFKRKTTLDFHERIHTGYKTKVCTECGKAFVQRASLKYHMEKYHPEVHSF